MSAFLLENAFSRMSPFITDAPCSQHYNIAVVKSIIGVADFHLLAAVSDKFDT